MNRDEIAELSLEEMLRELARDLPGGRTLNRQDYYQLLGSAEAAFTFAPAGATASDSAVGFEFDGANYLVLFMTRDVAESVAERLGWRDVTIERVAAKHVMSHVPDGFGLIVDWQTNAEVRISPDEVIRFNEYFRIWRIRQEATDEWLERLQGEFVRDGIEESRRAAETMTRWRARNGFRVLPGSRRARRIEHFFAVAAAVDRPGRRECCEQRWRAEYAADPQLHHLDIADLRARLETIMANLLFADRGALPHELTQLEWTELFHQVRFECERRGIRLIDEIRSTNVLSSWPNIERVHEIFASYQGPRGQLFRFSKREFLEPFIEEGDLKIFPAATYADPSLLRSQRDDELGRSILVDGSRERFHHIDRNGVRREIPVTGPVKITMSSPSNYYVWFTTSTFDPRLFDDFKADACVVIHDAREFTERLFRATNSALQNWPNAENLVRYFDPLRAQGEVLGGFEKDFKFAYQREYRFVWDPPSPEIRKNLPRLELKLGSLRDIASLLTLNAGTRSPNS